MSARIFAAVVIALAAWLPATVAEAAGGAHHDLHAIGLEGASPDPAEFKTDLAIYTLIVFVLLLAILKRFAWGPLIAAIDSREAGIRRDIAEAEAARRRSQELLAEHEMKLAAVQDEVREIIAEARRDAEHTRDDIVATAQTEAERTKQRAVEEINRARDQALKELFDTMSRQVLFATEQVLGRSVSQDDHERLVEEALGEFSRGAR